MKILAVVLARGGSVRLPGKNIRLLAGKPLIQWSIDVVKGLKEIKDILVSTDDEKIAEVALTLDVLVPWLRPRELSGSESTSAESLIHAVDWYESIHGLVDGVMLLQPTSPLRSLESIKRAIEIYEFSKYETVIGVTEVKSEINWWFKENEEGKLEPWNESKDIFKQSQDKDIIYKPNGAMYLISPTELREDRDFYSGIINPLIMPEEESVDIDEIIDFNLAEALLK